MIHSDFYTYREIIPNTTNISTARTNFVFAWVAYRCRAGLNYVTIVFTIGRTTAK